MLPISPLSEEFFSWLLKADAEIALRVAAAGCPWCGGPLHKANYERKPRGGLWAMTGEAFSLRHSLCCGRKGCRKRTLPPSLRFLGRRVYLEVVIVLSVLFFQVKRKVKEACKATGVPAWTLRRLRRFWSGPFVHSRTWVELRARFAPPPPDETCLPRSVFERIEKELGVGAAPPVEKVCLFLAGLLSPLTTNLVTDISSFLVDLPWVKDALAGHAKDVA